MDLLKRNWSLSARWALSFGLALSLPHVHAQTAVAKDAATKLSYVSALSHYQAFQAQTVLPWRESNQIVEKIGGWMAYAKEARAPETGEPSEDATHKHAGHGKHANHRTAP